MSYNPVPKLTNGNATFDNDVNVSGLSTAGSGVLLVDLVPASTTNKLYNDGGTLKFNGSAIGGAGVGSSSITVRESDGTPNVSNVSTIVVSNGTLTDDGSGQVTISTGGGGGTGSGLPYSSGDYYLQEIRTNSASGVAISGYFESRVDTNAADIVTVSGLIGGGDGGGTGSGLPYSSGDYYLQEIRANSASGLVNLNNINTVSGLIPPNTFNITGGDDTNYTIDGMGLNNASDPTMYIHKGHTYVFNKTFSGHPFAISATDGGSVYSDADGNAIEIGSSAGSVTFEVPQDAPDKLYYYCTSHPSAMKGVIYTTTDGATSGYFETRVDQNAADIITVSGLTGSSSLTVRDVDGTPSISNVTTIEVTNGSLTDQGGGVVRIATSGGGGVGTSYTSGSGLTLVGSEFNVYGGSGNFRYAELTASDEVPTFKYLGSGVTDTPINLEVRSSLQSATGSGTALLFQGTQGQLFSITDNLSSGVIFNVSDITGLPMLEITASGDVEIGEFADTITVHQPILLSGGVPTDTTNKLYNDAGTLKFNGSTVGGSGSSSYTAGSGLTLAGTEFNVYGGSGHFANLEIKPNAATDTGLVVQGAVSQAANLQEWQNSSENTLAHVDSSGVYTNIIGTSGTDTLRVKYGTPLHDHDGSSGADVTGVWLDYEDGSEYSTTINTNALIIGTWYNTAKTTESRIRISATAFNVRLAGSSKIDCQGSTTKFNTDVTPWSSSSTLDLGSESVPWTNVYASGATVSGVELLNHVPADTTNRLYNEGGTLKFNGSTVGGSSSLTAGSGLVLVGTEFNVHGGSGHFINLDVEGAFTATTKSFLIDHPSKEGMKLQYASLEGPENGVYVRGTTRQGFITLPDYWKDLVDNDSITVTLTPIGQFQPIFVKQKNNREIRVGGVCGDYDYVVWGERKDVNKLEVEW